MKKYKFYLCLNVLNILLALYIVAMAFALWITLSMAPNALAPICLFVLLIIIKLFFLAILFYIVKKKFPKSLLGKMSKALRINPRSRKSVLLLTLGYDVVIILYFAFPLFKEAHYGSLLFFPILWEIYTLGGVCMFYISLFLIWKIQDKKSQKLNENE